LVIAVLGPFIEIGLLVVEGDLSILLSEISKAAKGAKSVLG
jgi:hypothetical protein